MNNVYKIINYYKSQNNEKFYDLFKSIKDPLEPYKKKPGFTTQKDNPNAKYIAKYRNEKNPKKWTYLYQTPNGIVVSDNNNEKQQQNVEENSIPNIKREDSLIDLLLKDSKCEKLINKLFESFWRENSEKIKVDRDKAKDVFFAQFGDNIGKEILEFLYSADKSEKYILVKDKLEDKLKENIDEMLEDEEITSKFDINNIKKHEIAGHLSENGVVFIFNHLAGIENDSELIQYYGMLTKSYHDMWERNGLDNDSMNKSIIDSVKLIIDDVKSKYGEDSQILGAIAYGKDMAGNKTAQLTKFTSDLTVFIKNKDGHIIPLLYSLKNYDKAKNIEHGKRTYSQLTSLIKSDLSNDKNVKNKNSLMKEVDKFKSIGDEAISKINEYIYKPFGEYSQFDKVVEFIGDDEKLKKEYLYINVKDVKSDKIGEIDDNCINDGYISNIKCIKNMKLSDLEHNATIPLVIYYSINSVSSMGTFKNVKLHGIKQILSKSTENKNILSKSLSEQLMKMMKNEYLNHEILKQIVVDNYNTPMIIGVRSGKSVYFDFSDCEIVNDSYKLSGEQISFKMKDKSGNCYLGRFRTWFSESYFGTPTKYENSDKKPFHLRYKKNNKGQRTSIKKINAGALRTSLTFDPKPVKC